MVDDRGRKRKRGCSSYESSPFCVFRANDKFLSKAQIQLILRLIPVEQSLLPGKIPDIRNILHRFQGALVIPLGIPH